MFVPIGQWAPDADSTSGALTDVLNVTPTQKGYKGAPSSQNVGVNALASACLGAAVVRSVSGSDTIYAGTATGLYQLSGTTWNDVTRTSGGAYSTSSRWRFCQFGNDTIAVNESVATQYFASSGTDFADLTGAPKARVCETVGEFALFFATNEATYGDQKDRWWCSAIGDHTDWTPDIATQCVTGRLYDSPGPFTGAKRLNDYIVAFKERAIYIGTYVGPPTVWNWTRVSDTIGCSSNEAIVNIGQALLFASKDGLFMFDGASITPIDTGKIAGWWRDSFDFNFPENISGFVNQQDKTVYWWYPSLTSGGALNNYISYHWPTGKFGYGEESVEITVNYVTPPMNYDQMGARFDTYDDLPNITYEANLWLGSSVKPALFDTAHTIKTFDGETVSSYITSGDFGEEGVITLVKRLRYRYSNDPDSSTLTNYYADNLGGTYTTDATTTVSSGKFDFLRASRWHRFKISTTGNFEVLGADIAASNESEE